MKLTVSRETFLARLGVAVRGASTRGPVPSLAGVLLRDGSRRTADWVIAALPYGRLLDVLPETVVESEPVFRAAIERSCPSWSRSLKSNGASCGGTNR